MRATYVTFELLILLRPLDPPVPAGGGGGGGGFPPGVLLFILLVLALLSLISCLIPSEAELE